MRRAMISPRGDLDLPEGYVVQEEEPDFLILRRKDQSIVGVFPLSITCPNPESIQKTAEEDHKKLERKR